MQRADTGGSLWQSLITPRPYVLILLIVFGILLEFAVHFLSGIEVVYTHIYDLIIIIAGLWYGRKAVWAALVFGSAHIIDSFFMTGIMHVDAFIRASMFVLIALIVGMTQERSDAYRNELVARNRELVEVNTQLDMSRNAFLSANKKLNLLSSVTRHDIRNQLLALMGFIGLSKMKTTDPDLLHYIGKEEAATLAIQRQIEFTKNYEEIGVRAPQWQDIGMLVESLLPLASADGIEVTVSTRGLEVFTDPLLEKVFENLIDNSLRHGGHVRHISVSAMQYGLEYFAIVYEDDGVGVHEEIKEKIFEKGYGKNTGLGLFLTREILSITGLTIKECGEYGRGIRFEILVPEGKYRFRK